MKNGVAECVPSEVNDFTKEVPSFKDLASLPIFSLFFLSDIPECGQDIASCLIEDIVQGNMIVHLYTTLKYAKAQAERSVAEVSA